MSDLKLVSVLVSWKTESGAEPVIVYRADELGEGVMRQRAAMKVTIVRAAGLTVTAYRLDYEDGSTQELI